MSSQDRKYFRFRFSRILVSLILFISPTPSTTNKSSVQECFLELKRTLISSQSDDEFKKSIITCLRSVEWQKLSNFSIQSFQALIEKIPPEIANSLKGDLFVMCVSLTYFSHQLYKQSVNLEEECKQHWYDFKKLKTTTEVAFVEIRKEIYSISESTDFDSLYVKITRATAILEDFHKELELITYGVKESIIASRHSKPLAIGYGVVAAVVCVGSFNVGGPWTIILICTPACGVVAYSTTTFLSLEKTNEELNWLQKDTRNLGLELAKHQARLQVRLILMKGPSKEFHIKSEGCEDPNVKQMENTCGFAYIKVNGIDFSPHGRGCNVVVVDGRTGGVLERKTFDTNENPSAGDHLKEYLDGLDGNKIVLVAIQDEGSMFMKSALDALKRLGATEPVVPDYQGSFAFVGYAGVNKPSWIAQKSAKRGQGPSEIFLKIP